MPSANTWTEAIWNFRQPWPGHDTLEDAKEHVVPVSGGGGAELTEMARALGTLDLEEFSFDEGGFEDLMGLEEALRERVAAWQRRHVTVHADLEGRSADTKAALLELREAIEKAEGQKRLRSASLFRELAGGGQLTKDRVDQLQNDTRNLSALSSLKTELSDIALYCEELVGEANPDRLVDYKDNRFMASLGRLQRDIEHLKLSDTSVKPRFIALLEHFETKLFGAGYVVDRDHQTIVPGAGGLYKAEEESLATEGERRGLQEEQRLLEDRMRTFAQKMHDAANTYYTSLTRESEAAFTKALRDMIILSALASILFVFFASRVVKAVKAQVVLIKEANSALEERGRALEETRAFLQTVIDGIPDPIMVIDRQYTVLLANRSTRLLSGEADPVAACLKCHQIFRHRDDPCEGEDDPCPFKETVSTKKPQTV